MATEEPTGLLSYKVYVLKVSVHCDGCKKKIHRILKQIDGVYKVDVDAAESKVTVIANVDGDTLVRRLAKSRKYAELLPPPEKKAVDGGGPDPKDETEEPSEPKQQQGNATEDTAATAVSLEQKTADEAAAPAPPADAAAEPAKIIEEVAEESGKEQANSDDEMAEVSNTPPEKADEAKENAPATSEEPGAGGGRKKKGKKAQKGGNGEVADASRSVDAVADGPVLMPAPYIYPYPLYAPLQQHPSYVMSYNVAESSVSGTHYVPAVHPASPAFVYHQPYLPPPEFYYLPHQRSYSMFSEENPNACSVM